jgi:hypothetical protein
LVGDALVEAGENGLGGAGGVDVQEGRGELAERGGEERVSGGLGVIEEGVGGVLGGGREVGAGDGNAIHVVRRGGINELQIDEGIKVEGVANRAGRVGGLGGMRAGRGQGGGWLRRGSGGGWSKEVGGLGIREVGRDGGRWGKGAGCGEAGGGDGKGGWGVG